MLKSFKERTLIPVRAKKRADVIGWPPDAPGPPDVILSWANATREPDRRAKKTADFARAQVVSCKLPMQYYMWGCEGETAPFWHIGSFFRSHRTPDTLHPFHLCDSQSRTGGMVGAWEAGSGWMWLSFFFHSSAKDNQNWA